MSDKTLKVVTTETEPGVVRLELSGALSGGADILIPEYDIAIKDSTRKIIINLDEVTELDSVGLGMLMVLRKKAEHNNQKIHLINASKDIHRILKLANADNFFKIEN